MTGRKKEAGNVGEILTMGLCILALTAVMISYMENVQLIAKNSIRNSPSTQEACPRSLVFRCRYSFFINFISFLQPAMNLQYNVISVSRRI